MDLSMLMTIALAALAIGGLAGAVHALRGEDDPVRRRLQGTRPQAQGEAAAPLVLGRAPAPVATGPLAGEARKPGALEQRLIQAGLRKPWAPRAFLAAKVALAVLLPLVFLTINALVPEGVAQAAPIAIALGAFGMMLPNMWVSSRIAERRTLIDRGLPDALDLMVTCVEAGLGLDAAMLRVSEDIELSWPLLSEELELTFLEIKAGMPRTEAFRRLYERTGADELKSLAATLAQAEMFGTSVALALRIQASGLRTRRMHRAEERAATVAVKMTVPLVLCILPSLMAVIMGPAAVNIYNALFPALGAR
jgi:tight adherence protein C